MNPTIRVRLEGAKADLERIDPLPWSNVSTWAAGVRVMIRAGASTHLDHFDKLVEAPRGTYVHTPYVSPWLNRDRRDQRLQGISRQNADYTQRHHAAKASLLAFLGDLLALPAELFEPAQKDTMAKNITNHTVNISNSHVGAIASGHGATAHGSVQTAITQADHRTLISQAQEALVRDQDALDDLGAGIYDALYQFLRIARSIQVEQKNMAVNQAQMKDALDTAWAEQMTKGMRSTLLPKTLEVVKALASNPVMAAVVKHLLENPPT